MSIFRTLVGNLTTVVIIKKGQRKGQKEEEELPDLNARDVQDAALKIQSAFRGHKVRKTKRPSSTKEDLPDLRDKGE